ncbi:MAG: chitobiase/beta-hexosaminidase C-terminal domain-containing protein, partial [Phaeodactylibacter sp.]|nr:chitobiase/beta-hexosaminidase C-terminal domain-containing protein [Phaeodactylibacter sp.]
SNADPVEALILDVDYDDSFVAYINGQEVARANISGLNPAYNATSLTDHEAQMYSGGLQERFAIDVVAGLLQDGDNVLCIQVHNVSTGSSDMSMIPFLTAAYSAPTTDGVAPPAILGFENDQILHTNFKFSSAGETVYLFDELGELADSLVLPALQPDISYGVPTGQPDMLHYFDLPTPAAANPDAGYLGISTDNIVFSHPGGVTAALNLALSGVDPPAVIHYTLDATPPTESSALYTDPIPINENTVVRARVFQADYLPSVIQSRSYLVDLSHDLPMLTLVADPPDFFDEETGIYVFGNSYEPNIPYFGANFWEDWERPIHLTIYEEDGTLGAAFDGGVKIFGGYSRSNDQRSLSIFARGKYGFNEFDYPFFPD